MTHFPSPMFNFVFIIIIVIKDIDLDQKQMTKQFQIANVAKSFFWGTIEPSWPYSSLSIALIYTGSPSFSVDQKAFITIFFLYLALSLCVRGAERSEGNIAKFYWPSRRASQIAHWRDEDSAMENDLVKELTIPVYIWSLSDLVDRKRLKKLGLLQHCTIYFLWVSVIWGSHKHCFGTSAAFDHGEFRFEALNQFFKQAYKTLLA